MPRRNQRPPMPTPLDIAELGKAPPLKLPPLTLEELKRKRAGEAEQAREQADAARISRMAEAAGDWKVCIIPGCGRSLLTWDIGPHRDVRDSLPICHEDKLVIWRQVQRRRGDPEVIRLAEAQFAAAVERDKEAAAAQQARFLARQDGHIYFVRLNGLIKVGWSREVKVRLRAYGPDVQILAVYPGSRTDETNLHRQLRPALARGREWYQDGQIIADFVQAAVTKWGEPTAYTPDWTAPKQVVAGKRAQRR